MVTEPLFFESLKENRGSYFVEYQPPVAGNKFAILTLVFTNDVSAAGVLEAMHFELRYWLARYPVPLMVGACDSKEDTICPAGSEGGWLVGWRELSGEIHFSWRLNDLTEFLNSSDISSDWRSIFKDIPYRKDTHVKTAARNWARARARQTRLLRFLLLIWISAIPLGIAVFEYLGPEWVGLVALLYVLWKALHAGMKLYGFSRPSAKEEREAERTRKMEHYFYHCELNPEGFGRLKTENFERDARKRTQAEAAQLAGREVESQPKDIQE